MSYDESTKLQQNLRSDLNAERDSIKQVFSLVIEHLGELAYRRGQRIIPLGPFFRWAQSDPSVQEVREGLIERRRVRGMPQDLENICADHPIYLAAVFIFDLAEEFNIASGADVCRLLGFVCQSFIGDALIRKTNVEVAKTCHQRALQHRLLVEQRRKVVRAYQDNGGRAPQSEPRYALQPKTPEKRTPVSLPLAPAPRPQNWPTLTDRTDENPGGFASADGISLWFATHVGPGYAQKGENQDAAYALACGSRVYFAISDGVSTSVGSRFAAATIVKLFCNELADRFRSSAAPIDDENLKSAARSVHDWLKSCLAYLSSSTSATEWGDVRGASTLDMEVVVQLAENTISPKNRFWAPLMASTLLGGVVERIPAGTKVSMIRIGDGISESIDRLQNIKTIFDMDASETEVSAAIGPGSASEAAIANAEYQLLFLEAGEIIFASSDGLVRGHDTGLIPELKSIYGERLVSLNRWRETTALDVLKAAAEHADEAFKANADRKLFADNLSLVVIADGRT